MFSTGDPGRGLLLPHSMSEETAPIPEQEPAPQAAETPRVRRISNPRPKKQAKNKDAEPAPEAAAEIPAAPVVEVSESSDEAPETNDWPETEPATVGGQPQGEGGSKRKRRRKKGKGGQNAQSHQQQAPVSAEGEPTIETVVESPQQSQPQRHQAPPQPQNRPKVDPELLAKFAWKIYLSEVSEEGIALISDNDAREITRRCFRLAEIFLEEQGRRR